MYQVFNSSLIYIFSLYVNVSDFFLGLSPYILFILICYKCCPPPSTNYCLIYNICYIVLFPFSVKSHRTALWMAAWKGFTEVVDSLAMLGADLNTLDGVRFRRK